MEVKKSSKTTACLRACYLHEWYKWIKENFYPSFDFNDVWEELLSENEFDNKFADYCDIKFHDALESISNRASNKLKNFCDGVLVGWDKKILKSPNMKHQEEKGKTYSPKRIKFMNSPSSVTTQFVSEGFSINNFYSTRSETVNTILKKTNESYSYLVHGPSFTGKTSLCSLIVEQLQTLGKDVIDISMLGYSPSSFPLSEFWKKKTNRSYFDCFNNQTELYILIDELQMLYPQTKEEIVASYQLKDENAIIAPEEHHHFFECFKSAMQGQIVKVIAFSAFGSYKIGALLPTPVNFGCTSEHYNFTDNELQDLFSNFVLRTQIKFISDTKLVPQYLPTFLQNETNYHIGYSAAILHILNSYFLKFNDEKVLQEFLYSKTYYSNLKSFRPLPSILSLKPKDRNSLIEFWYKKEDIMCEQYTDFVKKGWIGLNSNTQKVYLYCSLYRQLLMMELFYFPRPTIDQFENSCDFMQSFLSCLKQKDLASNLSKSKNDIILESWWQAEFYRISCSLLGESSTISVEVGPKANIPNGRLDFYINGTRRWAFEFLICGQEPITNFDNRLEEHTSRFDIKGKYAPLNPHEYLVVDFRPQYTTTGKSRSFSDSKHIYRCVWIVLYDNINFQSLKIIKFSSTGHKTEEIIILI